MKSKGKPHRPGFMFWALAPALILFFLYIPFMMEEWNPKSIALTAGLCSITLFLFLGLLNPRRFNWAWRAVGALVFLAYVAYLLSDLLNANEVPMFNAIAGLVVLGIPGLLYAVLGRFPIGRREEQEFSGYCGGPGLYRCLVCEDHPREPFFQTYWANADHPGEAIQNALDAARANDLSNPVVTALGDDLPYYVDDEVEPDTSADVFWSTTLHGFPPEPGFTFPHGIVPALAEGPHDPADIRPGYQIVREGGVKPVCTIGVNVSRDQLLPLYTRLLRLFEDYEVFWCDLHDHYEKDGTELLLTNEDLNTPDKILGFLEEHLDDTVYNGHVTLTAYRREGQTNLNISDHKRIVIMMISEEPLETYLRALQAEGYEEDADLLSIDTEFYHVHYRLPGSRDRAGLERYLKEAGFKVWDN